MNFPLQMHILQSQIRTNTLYNTHQMPLFRRTVANRAYLARQSRDRERDRVLRDKRMKQEMSAGESTGWGVVNRGYQPHTHTHIILTTCSSTHLVCQFSPTKKKSNCYLHCATIVHRTKRQVTHTHQNLEKKEQ